MLIIMSRDATGADVDRVVGVIEEMGFQARRLPGAQRTVVGIVGNETRVDETRFESLPGVASVQHVTPSHKLASREWRQEDTVVSIGGVPVGGRETVVIAGPCSVESEEQIVATARAVREAGASALRGGAFKPRSSPYSFQGLGRRGLELLALARQESGLPVVTEAMDEAGAELIAKYGDCIQIGARNMQNYSLLKAVGRMRMPVLLKRGFAATISDLLLSAEYLLAEGNEQVILCERGVRGFDPSMRNQFDLAAIPTVQRLSHLPILADPSHGTGRRDAVPSMTRAAVAAGAAGILIEVHPHPERARSDGAQSLSLSEFAQLMEQLRPIAAAVGRSLASSPGTVSPARG